MTNLDQFTIVRKASITDIDKLSQLFDKYRVFYEMKSDIIMAENFLRQRIVNNESEIIIAENKNTEMFGFVQLYPLFSSTRMQRLWLLNDLFVIPLHRGNGISIKLINAAKNLCIKTKACGISLETAKSNDIGNILYPKADFNLDKDHNYYFWANS